ncbi:GntP family permease [Anaerococcus porci]|uniref:GntP family permease n=1 Tax=Anaerococcus porci TaxID=2652269 RepID=UPI002A756889|nr:GntP family permease [Anaerococcus porci]MDY3006060.1 GntP family permease [Anaerococcus porci]
MTTTTLTILALFIALFILIFSTVKLKLHPFFALLAAGFSFGIISGMSLSNILEAFQENMGSTIAGIGVVIAIGTVTGYLLEKSGAVETMAQTILKITGKKHASLGLAITGYFVSIPVFCDAAVVLLAPIAKRISKDSKISMTSIAVSLTMGLHATHMFVPPTPGPLAVAGIVGADLGYVIGFGALVSIPVMLVAHFYGEFLGKKYNFLPKHEIEIPEGQKLPSVFMSFAPIVLPIILMLIKTFTDMLTKNSNTNNALISFINFIGEPMIALLIGMIIALLSYMSLNKDDKEIYTFDGGFGEALKTAGQIVLIVGAGGAFGGILRASELQNILINFFSGIDIGILAPFIIGAIFRTAIGSGTVAMVTAASMLAPLLGVLGISSPMGLVIAMLACASGGSMIFHANDDFFWVATSTLEIDTGLGYKSFSIASVLQAVTGLAMVYILKLILL